MTLRAVPYEDCAEEWDSFASESDAAWFWHRSEWMEYSREYASDRLKSNKSFGIVENQRLEAICPLFVETSGMAGCDFEFSYGGGPVPYMAIRDGLPAKTEKRLRRFYIERLRSIAEGEGVGYISVRVPPVARRYLLSELPYANPLAKFGFVDLPYYTRIIDLRQDEDSLWSDVRSGPKSHIKSAERECDTTVWYGNEISKEKFRDYQTLHRKDAGRVTRPQATFDLMRSWVEKGAGILVEAYSDNRPIAFSLFIRFDDAAYYASSCKDPDLYEIPGSHLIQWRAMLWMKRKGIKWYDIGSQHFAPQLFAPATEKDISISEFKRQFGGTTIPVLMSEFFYSRPLLKQTLRRRLEDYLDRVSDEKSTS